MDRGGNNQNYAKEIETARRQRVIVREGFTNTEERREEKGKGKRERYTQLDAEFQRIARRDKKAFLNEQCKEIEENNRMGKTRNLQENRKYQGNISYMDGHNKEQKW